MQLHNTPSLDIKVREAMIKVLGGELAGYVGELREKAIEGSTPPQLDSTSASSDLHGSGEADIRMLTELVHRNHHFRLKK